MRRARDVYGVLVNLMCCDRFAGRLEDREEGEAVSSDEETKKVRLRECSAEVWAGQHMVVVNAGLLYSAIFQLKQPVISPSLV